MKTAMIYDSAFNKYLFVQELEGLGSPHLRSRIQHMAWRNANMANLNLLFVCKAQYTHTFFATVKELV
jgi:hypothetical protein